MVYQFSAKGLEDRMKRKVEKMKLHLKCSDNRELLEKLIKEREEQFMNELVNS